MYYTKYRGYNLELLGIYITEHNAFDLPKFGIGRFEPKLGGLGINMYAVPEAKTITLTVKVENGSDQSNLLTALSIFSGSTLSQLVLEERPELYIECVPINALEVEDTPSVTTLSVTLLAPFPFFLSNDLTEITPSGPIVMDGNAPCYPLFTISGPATDPELTITNNDGAIKRKYTGTLGSSDVLVFDALNSTSYFNGHCVDGLVTGDRLRFLTGQNTVALSSGALLVKYRNTYY